MEAARPASHHRARRGGLLAGPTAAALAIVVACGLAGCDSAAGIEGTDYHTSHSTPVTTTPAATATPVGAPAAAPVPSVPPAPPVTIALAQPNSAADAALTRWVADLRRLPADQLTRSCWTLPPHDVDSMYARPQPILDALAQPGIDTGSSIVWKGPDSSGGARGTDSGSVTVVAQRGDIATGYACPRVFPAGTDPGFGEADARHTVRRYLDRAVGTPINPADTETTHPLLCGTGVSWDPTGTGRPGTAPLAAGAGRAIGVKSFVDSSITSASLRGDYTVVTVQTVGDGGAEQERTVTLKSGEQGYCIGEVSA